MILEFSTLQSAVLARFIVSPDSFLPNQLLGLSGETWFMQTIRMLLNQIFKETTVTIFFKYDQWYFKVSLLGGQAGALQFSCVAFLLCHIITKVGLLVCCSLLTIDDRN